MMRRRRRRFNITTTLHAQNPQRMANPIEKYVRVETPVDDQTDALLFPFLFF
jgi:hypothetical protein